MQVPIAVRHNRMLVGFMAANSTGIAVGFRTCLCLLQTSVADGIGKPSPYLGAYRVRRCSYSLSSHDHAVCANHYISFPERLGQRIVLGHGGRDRRSERLGGCNKEMRSVRQGSRRLSDGASPGVTLQVDYYNKCYVFICRARTDTIWLSGWILEALMQIPCNTVDGEMLCLSLASKPC